MAGEAFAHAQASYTASRAGDLQVGGGISFGSSNYLFPQLGATFRPPIAGMGESLRGFNLYSLGVELNFRQTSPSYGRSVYERTYEIGGRYVYPVLGLRPYAKAMYGRGVFNYPDRIANLAYNSFSFGAGADYPLLRSVNLRADYEYQRWLGFPLSPLQPNIVTIGAAYHFSGEGHCRFCANR